MLRSYGDSRVFGETYGTGPVRVVWLHGWARQAHDFAPAAQLLADRGIASVALDLPGFGSSPPPSSAGGARHYAELIAADAARDLRVSPWCWSGTPSAGASRCVVASEHPELVRRIGAHGRAPLRAPRRPARVPMAYRAMRFARSTPPHRCGATRSGPPEIRLERLPQRAEA